MQHVCGQNESYVQRGNYEYIDTPILWIYHRYIGGYFGKKYDVKLIKLYKNIRKTL